MTDGVEHKPASNSSHPILDAWDARSPVTGHRSPATEDSPVGLDDMVGHNTRSKLLAEQEVPRLLPDDALPAFIVTPSAPPGPRHVKPTVTGAIIVDEMNGRTSASRDTSLDSVHVHHLPAGHSIAFHPGRTRERYLLGSESLTLRDIPLLIADIIGRRAPLFRLPQALAMLIACVSEGPLRLVGRGTPSVSIDSVRMSDQTMFFTCNKAPSELGFAPRPANNTLPNSTIWFQVHNTHQ